MDYMIIVIICAAIAVASFALGNIAGQSVPPDAMCRVHVTQGSFLTGFQQSGDVWCEVVR